MNPYETCEAWAAAMTDEPTMAAARDLLAWAADDERGVFTDLGRARPWQLHMDDAAHVWAEHLAYGDSEFKNGPADDELYEVALAMADVVLTCVLASVNHRTAGE